MIKCQSCQHDNLPEARFCARCGTALVEVAAASPTPATPSAPRLPAGPDKAVIEVEYAGFWIRFAAWLVDTVILMVSTWLLSQWSIAMGIGGGPNQGLDIVVGFLILGVPWLYYWLFTGLKGQTPAKMLVGIQVVNARGQVPGLGRAALRELLGKLISTLVLFIGFLWIAADPHKQGWHDKLATTYVVRRRRI